MLLAQSSGALIVSPTRPKNQCAPICAEADNAFIPFSVEVSPDHGRARWRHSIGAAARRRCQVTPRCSSAPKTESGEDTPTFAPISFLLLFCLFALALFQNTFPFHFSHLISLFFSILTTIAICMITWSVWQLSPSFSFSSEKVPFWRDASCTPGVNSPALRSLCSLPCHSWYG